jgi:hypothetical protein
MSLMDTSELIRKNALMLGIIHSLAHRTRMDAMAIVLSWFSVAELEDMYPIITGGGDYERPTS